MSVLSFIKLHFINAFGLTFALLLLSIVDNFKAAEGKSTIEIVKYSDTITNGVGIFVFSLSPNMGTNNHRLIVEIKARGMKDNELVHISEEAQALKKFLSNASSHGVNIKELECIYLPSTKESEVQDRMMQAASVSSEWKKRKPGNANEVVTSLLTRENAYREIAEVLSNYGLKIERIEIEKVMLKSNAGIIKNGQPIKVPYNSSTWLRIKTLS